MLLKLDAWRRKPISQASSHAFQSQHVSVTAASRGRPVVGNIKTPCFAEYMLLLRLQTHRIGIFPCLSGSAGAHGPLTHSFIPSAFALQVPFHLDQAVASATDPSTPRTYAGLSILSVLLSKAVKDGVCSGKPTPGATGGLQRSIHSQLQQSGFTAAVPQLLDSATAALNNISAEPALAQVPQQSSYNWIVTSAQTATVAGRVLSTQAAHARC
jgi:hypothetical protein